MKSSLPAGAPIGSFCLPKEKSPRKGPRKKSSIIPKPLADRNSSARYWPDKMLPLVSVRQLPAAGEFQVDDAAVEVRDRTRRAAAVVKQRPNGEDIAGFRQDCDVAIFARRCSCPVRAGEHAERTIVRRHVIQMNSQRQHL